MANGDLIKEVNALLDRKGAIPVRTALKLSLSMQVEMYQTQREFGQAQGELRERVEAIETKVDGKADKTAVEEVKRSSIVMWIEKHPKLSISILGIMAIVDIKALVQQVLQGLGIIH